MLETNGRPVKQRLNYFMTLDELAQLLHYLKIHYDPKWKLFVMIQFSLGMRCKEVTAIRLSDFEDDFKYLNYRETKTNKLIIREPVVEVVRLEIKEYVRLNAQRMINGNFFGTHNGPGEFVSVNTVGSFWARWRKGCARFYNNSKWLDGYELKPGIIRHRIGSHSLRRLHRTYLAGNLQNDWIAAKLCHYKDTKTLTIYRDEFELMSRRDTLILPIMNPIMEKLTSVEVKIVPDQKGTSTATVEKILLLDNKPDL